MNARTILISRGRPACSLAFLSGVIQTAGAFCTDWLRRHTPRAALLCPLAGIAMAFLCLGFVLRVFQVPSLALLPAIVDSDDLFRAGALAFSLAGRARLHRHGAILAAVLKAAASLSFAGGIGIHVHWEFIFRSQFTYLNF